MYKNNLSFENISKVEFELTCAYLRVFSKLFNDEIFEDIGRVLLYRADLDSLCVTHGLLNSAKRISYKKKIENFLALTHRIRKSFQSFVPDKSLEIVKISTLKNEEIDRSIGLPYSHFTAFRSVSPPLGIFYRVKEVDYKQALYLYKDDKNRELMSSIIQAILVTEALSKVADLLGVSRQRIHQRIIKWDQHLALVEEFHSILSAYNKGGESVFFQLRRANNLS